MCVGSSRSQPCFQHDACTCESVYSLLLQVTKIPRERSCSVEVAAVPTGQQVTAAAGRRNPSPEQTPGCVPTFY